MAMADNNEETIPLTQNGSSGESEGNASGVNKEAANNDVSTGRDYVTRLVVGTGSRFLATVLQLAGVSCLQLIYQLPPDFELNTLRFLVGFILCGLFLLLTRTAPKVAMKDIKWVLLLCLVNTGYNLCFYSHYIKRIPIVTLFCYYLAYKVLLTLVLSKVVLRYEISVGKYVICILNIFGAILTLIPAIETYKIDDSGCSDSMQATNSSDTGTYTLEEDDTAETNLTSITLLSNDVECYDIINAFHDISDFVISCAVVTVSALFTTICCFIVTASSLQEIHVNIISFWPSLLGMLVSTSLAAMFETPIILRSNRDIMLCFGHSIGAFGSTYLEVVGLKNCDVNINAIISTLLFHWGCWYR